VPSRWEISLEMNAEDQRCTKQSVAHNAHFVAGNRMRQDDRSGVVFKGFFDDFARMDGCASIVPRKRSCQAINLWWLSK
jgi:hypothetical protein